MKSSPSPLRLGSTATPAHGCSPASSRPLRAFGLYWRRCRPP